jgi:hypothetical protein
MSADEIRLDAAILRHTPGSAHDFVTTAPFEGFAPWADTSRDATCAPPRYDGVVAVARVRETLKWLFER